MIPHALKGMAWRLSLTAILLLGPSVFCLGGLGEAGQQEPSGQAGAFSPEQPSSESGKTQEENRPGWWQQHVTFSGDMRGLLPVNRRGNRDGTGVTNFQPVARLRGGTTIAPTPWLAATARLATFFDEDLQGLGFRFGHRRTIKSGDLTFDSVFLTVRPQESFVLQIGRLQTETPQDSVVEDSLSRHDSGGVSVNWTDGVHAILGGPASFKLHLIGQANPKEGSTNGVGVRGPLDFTDGAARVTYYVSVEAPHRKPFTQLVADVTIIPNALRPSGLGTDTKEDVVALTAKGGADFPLTGRPLPLILHPFMEVGAMVWTPRENVLKVSNGAERAGRFALVAGVDLKNLGPGTLDVQSSWIQAGYLISPDYPNNTWNVQARYKVGILKRVTLEVQYRHRQEIEKQVGARERQTDENVFARITVKF